MKIATVSFHQPVRFGNKQVSSINLLQEVEKKKYELNFMGGLLSVVDKQADRKETQVALVGLANIAYMTTDLDGLRSLMAPRPEKKVAAPKKAPATKKGDKKA